MRAILLCAGFGTRMLPLTARCPKPLLEVAGLPVLDYLVRQFIRFAGLRRIHLVTNARFHDAFLEWAHAAGARYGPFGLRFHIHNNGVRCPEERRGAVADLAFALERTGVARGALVSAGDTIHRYALWPVWRTHWLRRRNCVLALPQWDQRRLSRSGVLRLDAKRRVWRVDEKPASPPTRWECPSLYFLKASALRRVAGYLERHPEGRDTLGAYLAYLVRLEPVYAVPMRGSRFDIGSLDSFREADRELRNAPAVIRH